MIFTLTGIDEPRTLEVDRHGDTYRIVERDGPALEIDARSVAPGWWSLLIGARSYDAGVRRDGTVYIVEMEGRDYRFDLTDPARVALRPGVRTRRGAGEVTAPMPGRVVRVLVSPGDVVKQGDGVVVVEAMKMENELSACLDGVITATPAREGDTVEAGTLLVSIGEEKEA